MHRKDHTIAFIHAEGKLLRSHAAAGRPVMWGRNRSVTCARCGAQLAAPAFARTVRCPSCHAVTAVGSSHDPVRHAVGFVRSVFMNMTNGISSLSSSSGGWAPSDGYGANPGGALPTGFPRAHGKKRAVLIGISYSMTRYELKGTVNDVNCMAYFLSEKFGFPKDCIFVLTEEESDPNRRPTKENIRAAMRWLVTGCEAGDSLVFHYSGHGIQKLDSSGNELDGYDEALCPLDFETNGTIVDDEINATLVRPIRRGAKLHAIIDACHSGTVLDLPFLCRLSRTGFYQWQDHSSLFGLNKGTSGGLAILISGCDDHQTSADSSASTGSASTGAMTYSFLHAMEMEPGTTYGRLLMAMRSAIRDANSGIRLGGPLASLMRKVLSFRSTQEPQLSSSEIFDIYKKPFLL